MAAERVILLQQRTFQTTTVLTLWILDYGFILAHGIANCGWLA
jgi:hypothetical protein